MAQLLANKNQEIQRLNGIYRRLLENAGVTIIEQRALLVDAHTVEVEGKRYTARFILVATGGWPVKPAIPGAELAITSNEAFFLAALPRRVVVVGGGYIALEFASIFNGMGADTTLVYRGPNILRTFDRELGGVLAEEMQKKGVALRLNANIANISRSGDGLAATFADGATLDTDCILYATGRAPNTRGLGLEAAGVKLNAKGAIVVDAYSQSAVPSIYAIGDVTDRVNLTPVATAEGMAVANTLFNNRPTALDYANIPTAIFANPNAATVGLSEESARAQLWRNRRLRGALPSAEAHALRQQRADVHETRRRPRLEPRRRRAHDRRRCGRNHSGHRHRDQVRRDQGAVRRDHRHPSDRGRGIRHHAGAAQVREVIRSGCRRP